MPGSPVNHGNECAKLLGAELRQQRISHGLSLRQLAGRIGLSGHGGLVDYEHGRRIPPEDIVAACERVLDIRDGRLRDLRKQAVTERACREASLLLEPGRSAAADVSPDEPAEPVVRSRSWRWRAVWLAAGAVMLVGGAGLIVAWKGLEPSSPGARPHVRMGFETDAKRWWVLYGSQVAQIQGTTSIAYEGHRAELVTVSGASATKGYSAVGISHDLGGLCSGTRVTVHLWVPGPQEGGIAFLVHDAHGKNHWARENQISGTTQESETPLPSRAGWTTYTWTVPRVDKVTTIGLQVWAENDGPILIGVDAVDW